MAAPKTDSSNDGENDENQNEERFPSISTNANMSNNTRPFIGRNFRLVDGMIVLVSLITYLVDTLTDILVGVEYFHTSHVTWGALTLGLVLLPSIVIQLFSARWYMADGKMSGCHPWTVHILQLQPLERYLYVLITGFNARHSGAPDAIENYYYQQNDVCMLRLFEAFLESAPQLSLQVYIMVSSQNAHWLTSTSASISLIALGWAVAAYNNALRQAYRDNYRIFWPGLLLQTLWHMGMVASRVAALVAFASVYKGWIFIVLGLHWGLMTLWVYLQKTDFCPTRWEERLFNMVVGVIYCFCFFSLKEGATRWRMSAFYCIMFVENLILLGVWFPFRNGHGSNDYILMGTVFGGFIFGLMCMLVYYRFCHPSGPIYCLQAVPDSPVPSCHSSQSYPSAALTQKESTTKQLRVNMVPQYTSAPILPRKSLFKSSAKLPTKYISAPTLPRTNLLKSSTSRAAILYKEVKTPSQLTPVKCDRSHWRPVMGRDSTFEWDASSGFRHFSLDNSQCLNSLSQCKSMDVSGVELSRLSKEDTERQDDQDAVRDITREIQQECLATIAEVASVSDLSPCSQTPMICSNLPTPVRHNNQKLRTEDITVNNKHNSTEGTTFHSCRSSSSVSASSSESQYEMGLTSSSSGVCSDQSPVPKSEKQGQYGAYMSTPVMSVKFSVPQQLAYTPISRVHSPAINHYPVHNISFGDDGLYEFDEQIEPSATLDLSQYDNLKVSKTCFEHPDSKKMTLFEDKTDRQICFSSNCLEKETQLIRGMNTL